MQNYRCFVVLPFRRNNSEAGQLADDVFQLLIEPALEKFAFSVLRADEIASADSINKDLIEQIQRAQLCMIDITGHEPNVMYLCGRRHETGKPCIMIAREGESAPLDIANIRTIFYRLANGHETRGSVKAIQRAVAKIVDDGFQWDTSGGSLASLADAVLRIERTLDHLATGGAAASGGPSQLASDIIAKYGPVKALNYAFSQRKAELVDEILPMMAGSRGDDRNFVVAGLSQGAALGSRVAFDLLLSRIVDLDLSKFEPEDVLQIVGGFVTGANRFDEEKKALEVLEPVFKEAIEGGKTYSAKERAYLMNQKQRLLHALGRTKEAREIGDRVLEICPGDVSYLFNQSINVEAENDLKLAVQFVDRYMAVIHDDSEPDEDYLQRAVKIYAKAGEKEKARDAFQSLVKHHPYIADILKEDEDIRKVMT